jgi:glutamine synthetase
MSPQDALKKMKESGAQIGDLKFNDPPGLWQHFSIPFSEMSEMDDVALLDFLETSDAGAIKSNPLDKDAVGQINALMAYCAPTTNSYKRLVPGYEAPVNLTYSQRNRSAAIRIPGYSDNPKSERIECRPPDNTCNPYLAFSAMLMAGLDGIKNKIDPGEPTDKDPYHLTGADKEKVRTVPGSLEASLNALEKDHNFLLEGGVFTPDVIDVRIEYKREKEIDAVRLRPHPYEFYLYFDI